MSLFSRISARLFKFDDVAVPACEGFMCGVYAFCKRILLSLPDGIPALSGDWPCHLRFRHLRPGAADIHHAGIASNLADLPRIRRTRGPRDLLRGPWLGRGIHRGSTESGGGLAGGRTGDLPPAGCRLPTPWEKQPLGAHVRA